MALPGLRTEVPIKAKVRIGKKVNGNPVALDVFRSEDADFTQALGTPKTLRVTFPMPQVEDAFRTSLECWGTSLRCWCNDTVTAHRLNQGGGYDDVPCTFDNGCHQSAAGNCKPVGRLRFSVPGLRGIYQLDTKGWVTIRRLQGLLEAHAPLQPTDTFELAVTLKKRPDGKKYPVITLTPVYTDQPTDPTEVPNE